MNFAHFLQKQVAIVTIIALGMFPLGATAGELRLRAQLAWGTDDAKPPGQDLKEMDAKLREKFRHLRWKNYFIVKSEVSNIPTKSPKHVVLSEKCAVDLLDLGDGNVKITVTSLRTGVAPLVVKSENFPIDKLKGGYVWAFGGDTKEKWDDAWLVVVTSEE